jgi:uncharacterized protein YifE (UPF0438 family)
MEFWAAPPEVNLKERFSLKKLRHTKYNLSSEQKRVLRRQGYKYYQLMDGSIHPVSASQKHFVDMCMNLVEPQDEWEQTWKSYLFTLEEEKRLDAIYRAELRQSPRTEERLKRLWLSGPPTTSAAEPTSASKATAVPDRHTRECRLCRGSGMKADGDGCGRCNGRGWIEAKTR